MRHSALAIAFNEVARQSIMADPHWNHGDYYGGAKPGPGPGGGAHDRPHHLSLRRVHAPEVRPPAAGQERFLLQLRRRLPGGELPALPGPKVRRPLRRQLLSLHHQGGRLLRPGQAARRRLGRASACSKARAKFLVISFTSDWLYPTYQAREIVKALKKSGRDVSFCEIEAEWGHDAFLIPGERLKTLIHGFLERIHHESGRITCMRFDLQIIASWIEPGSRVHRPGLRRGRPAAAPASPARG
ncbi:MAG: hypothetical protein MZV64_04505 [Ignavibacteriales bacterium]|nr:hypothetical protein [Ignavibacteriales bacterium]